MTDSYEWGWGDSFHFAPRAPNECLAASLARHEHHLALRLGLRAGMRVADLGCGVGGPLREIARFLGATIVGVNHNRYQLERARKLTDEAGLGHLAEFVECDFMRMDAADDSFDAAYAIEATVHAPSKSGAYWEVFRVLRPGGCFAAYEYCLTHRFDPGDPSHGKIKSALELGGALPDIAHPHEVNDALREVGFELLEARDLAKRSGPGVPWYQPLAGSLGKASARVRGCELVEESGADRPSTALATSHAQSAAPLAPRPGSAWLGGRRGSVVEVDLERPPGSEVRRRKLRLASVLACGDRCSSRLAGRTGRPTGSLLSSGMRERPPGHLGGSTPDRPGVGWSLGHPYCASGAVGRTPNRGPPFRSAWQERVKLPSGHARSR